VVAATVYGRSRRNPVNAGNVNDEWDAEPTRTPAAV